MSGYDFALLSPRLGTFRRERAGDQVTSLDYFVAFGGFYIRMGNADEARRYATRNGAVVDRRKYGRPTWRIVKLPRKEP